MSYLITYLKSFNNKLVPIHFILSHIKVPSNNDSWVLFNRIITTIFKNDLINLWLYYIPLEFNLNQPELDMFDVIVL